MFESAGRTGAGLASVLGNLQPLVVIAIAAAVLAEPVTKDKAAALAVGLLGVTLMTAPAIGGADAQA
jgi:drug/metabolite transporter (DMT)-like permease